MLAPKWWSTVPEEKKKEYGPYWISILHHLYVIPVSAMLIWDDIHREENEIFDYKVDTRKFPAIVGSYLLVDFAFFVIPPIIKELTRGTFDKKEFLKKSEMVFHHILGLGCVIMAFWIDSGLCRYIPHMLMCEVSSLLFNSIWMIKTMGVPKTSSVVVIGEYLFAVLFTFTRIINLPLVVLSCYTFSQTVGLKISVVVILGSVVVLQFFWFFKIIASLTKKSNERNKGKNKDE